MTETQTVDLAAWLTQIWDEEERLAKAATPGPWDLQMHSPDMGGRHGFRLRGPLNLGPQAFVLDTRIASDNARHIVTHDPASVLARIAADRKILELHEPLYGGDERPYCETCGGWPCPTIRLLASPYKGREGWQDGWDHE